ncbi:HET-domain-containing protein, partial [Cadophora sp. DSE1049]
LSHRWVGNMPGRLTTENSAQLLHVIPAAFLSATFKDAIIVTRRLGFRYLWIDSLCIIQDSVEDWATESASMHLIYGNSSYNISALAASNYTQGLFLTTPVYSPIRISMSTDGIEASCILRMSDTWNDFVTSSPLNLRGWVCQERLLSPRTLHFTSHQLFWECGQLSASEDWPDGVPPRAAPKVNPNYPKYVLPHDDHEIKNAFSQLARSDIPVDRVTAQTIWAKVVKLYTRASLTFSTDKLIAISGIATRFQPHFRGRYLAGLWGDSIASELL